MVKKLKELGIENYSILEDKGIIELTIVGEVFVQEIKDNFNVLGWRYKGGNAEFFIK